MEPDHLAVRLPGMDATPLPTIAMPQRRDLAVGNSHDDAEVWAPPVEQRPLHSQAHHPRASRTSCKIPDRPPTDFRNFCKIRPWSLSWFGR